MHLARDKMHDVRDIYVRFSARTTSSRKEKSTFIFFFVGGCRVDISRTNTIRVYSGLDVSVGYLRFLEDTIDGSTIEWQKFTKATKKKKSKSPITVFKPLLRLGTLPGAYRFVA